MILAEYYSPWDGVCTLLGVGLTLFFAGALVRGYLRDRRLSLIGLLATIAAVSVVIGSLLPVTARIPRDHYRGKDQFEWADGLQSGDEAARKEAIVALCEILTRPTVRRLVAELLVHGKAREAIPLLRPLLTAEDEELRVIARELIERLESAGSEEP
jgi:hypothetical protein